MLSGSENSFYFATIRKTSLAVASVFKDIYIKRFTGKGGTGDVLKIIKVPISYATGSKWYVNKTQEVTAQSVVRSKIVLPRIGIKLTGFEYDSARKLQTTNIISNPNTVEAATILRSLNPVPYNLTYEVYIAVRNIDDGLQILEQVLPVFQPEYNISVKEIPELAVVRDIPLILEGVSYEDITEGTFDEARILEFTLTLTAQVFLYPSLSDGKLIHKVIASVYGKPEMDEDDLLVKITAEAIINTALTDDDGNLLTNESGSILVTEEEITDREDALIVTTIEETAENE